VFHNANIWLKVLIFYAIQEQLETQERQRQIYQQQLLDGDDNMMKSYDNSGKYRHIIII